MKKLLFLLAVLLMTQVNAQTKNKDRVVQLLELNGRREKYDALFDSYAVNKNNKATEVAKIMDKVAVVYAQYLSDNDIDAMMAYYNSASGKKLVNDRANMTEAELKDFTAYMNSPVMNRFYSYKDELKSKEGELMRKWLTKIKG